MVQGQVAHGLARFSLAGKRALVSGASRGIGRALAVGLAEAGADVAIAARQLASLDETAAAIAAEGRHALPLVMDVTDLASITAAVAQMCRDFGGIDILVNNAGIEQVSPSLEVTEDIWDRILDTNLKGAFFAAQQAAKAMIADGVAGSIVNLCSLTTAVGIPTAVPYGSSKTGLLGMTRALAAEWAPHRIRVNAIGPGYFRTDMTEVFYRDAAWRDAMLAKIPLQRFGELDDLIGSTIFLCADAAAYVTGQLLFIDGGYTASI
jgi:NAD(P)-dependent dehydrogenase (short-subunit alcohol dehydrogenase family)